MFESFKNVIKNNTKVNTMRPYHKNKEITKRKSKKKRGKSKKNRLMKKKNLKGGSNSDVWLASNFYPKFREFLREQVNNFNLPDRFQKPSTSLESKDQLTTQENPETVSTAPAHLTRLSSLTGETPELLECIDTMRISLDGRAYTLDQFKDFFGGTSEWDAAKDSEIPMTLEFNGTPLTSRREISHGSYGTVYEFTGDKDIKLAVKYFNNEKDFEIEKKIAEIIFDKIKSKEEGSPDNLGVIPSYFSNKCKTLVMHFKDGNLNNLKLPDNKPEKKRILKNIFQQVVGFIIALIQEDLFYTDLKLENILYQQVVTDDKKTYKPYLADIGGIILGDPFENSNSQNAVFSLPYKKYNIVKIKKEDNINNRDDFILSFIQQIMSFLVYLFEFIPRTDYCLWWDNFWIQDEQGYYRREKNDEQVEDIIKSIKGKVISNKFFKEIINESIFNQYFFDDLTQQFKDPLDYNSFKEQLISILTEIKDSIFQK